jgi:NAD-dependent dihydropyrimidine dehydrogenase PreA subunit
MRKAIVIAAMVLLPVLGGLAGRFAAPALARTHDTVRTAHLVRKTPETPTLAQQDRIDAFARGRRTRAELFAQADAVERRFDTGATILGVWCGLVLGFAVFGLHRTRRRELYEIDDASCVSCARCFRACPNERRRRAGTEPDPTGAQP